jgi:acyl-CoA thioester hydrolase
MMGVVYYANYLRYFEAGRNELLRAAGVEYKGLEADGYILPVASASAKYLASARYDDELELETRVEQLRFGSVRMSYALRRPADDALIATGETLHACLNRAGRVVRLPDALRLALAAE